MWYMVAYWFKAVPNGIEKVRAEMAGRGVLLDVARWAGVDFFEEPASFLEPL